MTEEEAKRLPVDQHQSADAPSEYEVHPDPEVVGIDMYKRLIKRVEMSNRAHGYRVVIPCCRCGHCIVIREMRNGLIVNTGYGCSIRRITCEAYGTCDCSFKSSRGPTVLVHKLKESEGKTGFKSLPGEECGAWTQDGTAKPDDGKKPSEAPKAVLSGKPSVIPRHLNS